MIEPLSMQQYCPVNGIYGHSCEMAIQEPRTFGERVRFARLKAKMTQAQLAKEAKIGQSAISSIEKGHTQWARGPNLLRLALALDVEPLWLENGTDTMRPSRDVAAYVFDDLLAGLSPDNRRRLYNMGSALLADQTAHTNPNAADQLLSNPPKQKLSRKNAS
jgi:transcriptional regulator with XRE-family HTH domain